MMPEEVFIKKSFWRYFRMEERKKHEIHWVNREDANFPERLKKLTGMPKKLYYIGNLPDPQAFGSSCGARMSSPYGRCQAFKYARLWQSMACRS